MYQSEGMMVLQGAIFAFSFKLNISKINSRAIQGFFKEWT